MSVNGKRLLENRPQGVRFAGEATFGVPYVSRTATDFGTSVMMRPVMVLFAPLPVEVLFVDVKLLIWPEI